MPRIDRRHFWPGFSAGLLLAGLGLALSARALAWSTDDARSDRRR